MDFLEGGDSFNFLLSVSSPLLGGRERKGGRGLNGCCAVMLQLPLGYLLEGGDGGMG